MVDAVIDICRLVVWIGCSILCWTIVLSVVGGFIGGLYKDYRKRKRRGE